MCGLIGALVYNTSTCNGRVNLHIRIQTVTLATVACVLSAFYYTGGFYQPLLAFIRTFGCVGFFRPEIAFYDHILVYWISPTLAAVVLTLVKPFLQNMC